MKNKDNRKKDRVFSAPVPEKTFMEFDSHTQGKKGMVLRTMVVLYNKNSEFREVVNKLIFAPEDSYTQQTFRWLEK